MTESETAKERGVRIRTSVQKAPATGESITCRIAPVMLVNFQMDRMANGSGPFCRPRFVVRSRWRTFGRHILATCRRRQMPRVEGANEAYVSEWLEQPHQHSFRIHEPSHSNETYHILAACTYSTHVFTLPASND